MNAKTYLLSFLLLGSSAALFAADAVEDKDLDAALKKIVDANFISRDVYNRANMDAQYWDYSAKVQLSEKQRFTFFKAVLDNAFQYSPERAAFADGKIRALPEAERTSLLKALYKAYTAPTATAEQFLYAEKLFPEVSKGSDEFDLLSKYGAMARLSLTRLGDKARYVKYLDALLALKAKDSLSSVLKKSFEGRKDNSFAIALTDYVTYDLEEALAFIKTLKAPLSDNVRQKLLETRIKFACKHHDRESFDAALKEIRALPEGGMKFGLLLFAAKSFPLGPDELKGGLKIEILDKLMAESQTPAQKVRVLGAYMAAYRPSDGSSVGFASAAYYAEGSYEKHKGYALELIKILDANEARRAKEPKAADLLPVSAVAAHYRDIMAHAYSFRDYAFGDELLAKALATGDRDRTLTALAEKAMREKKTAEAIKLYDEILASKVCAEKDKKVAAWMKHFLSGGTCEGFDAAFKDKNYTPFEKMKAIRGCGRQYFMAGQFEKCRELDEWVLKNMFREPVTNNVYKVKYIADAPQTADAWVKSPYYGDWKVLETRFYPIAGLQHGSQEDSRSLKDVPEEKLDDAYKMGLHVYYTDEGVHIFLRVNDPAMQELIEGKRKFGLLEWILQPGKEEPYHCWDFSLPDTTEPYYYTTSGVSKNYRLTYDFIKKDVALTKEAVVAHTFVPWMLFYDRLPSKTSDWRLNMQTLGRSKRSLAGFYHELERSLRLRFEFTPERLTSLKRTIARVAFNRYNTMRKDLGGRIHTWNDPFLGDQEFYAAVVAPLVADLDAAGERLMKPAPDSEIEEFYQKYVPQWAEINIVLAERRAAYLKTEFLTPPAKK